MAEQGGKLDMKFKENIKLKIVCIIGCIIFIFINIKWLLSSVTELPIYYRFNIIFTWPVTFSGAYLTYKDAVIIKAGITSYKEKVFDTKTWNPITWALMVWFFFPFSLPIYIYKRYNLYLTGLRYYYDYIGSISSGIDG
jgi:hypothetical protein